MHTSIHSSSRHCQKGFSSLHSHPPSTNSLRSPTAPRLDFSPIPSPPAPRRKGIYIASGLLIYALTTYTVYLFTTLNAEDTHRIISLPPPDTDVSSRYDTTAPHFDADVSFIERFSGINRRRRTLISQARGDVLEVCAGTGRNTMWYDLDKVKSVTFVDRSAPMIEVAMKKWQALHPRYGKAKFYTQSVMEPLPTDTSKNIPTEGFTTIVQTMGICSTPNPSAALAHLGTLAHPTEGRILLLEHGRGYYSWINWILDKSAARHADKHGCWYNRDVERVLGLSGLEIEKVERSHFGTLWYIEARPELSRNRESR